MWAALTQISLHMVYFKIKRPRSVCGLALAVKLSTCPPPHCRFFWPLHHFLQKVFITSRIVYFQLFCAAERQSCFLCFSAVTSPLWALLRDSDNSKPYSNMMITRLLRLWEKNELINRWMNEHYTNIQAWKREISVYETEEQTSDTRRWIRKIR